MRLVRSTFLASRSLAVAATLASAMWASAMLVACETPLRTLTVDVQTDLVPAVELGVLDIELLEGQVPRGSDAVRSRRALVSPAIEEASEYRSTKRVAELSGLAPGTYTLRVVGRRPAGPGLSPDSGTVLGERRVLVALERNRVVRVVLAASCVGVTCPGADDAEELTQCFNGRCVSPRCDPSLPTADTLCCAGPACGEVSLCESPIDCLVAPCATAACIDGACIAEDRPGACAEGEYCDRSAGSCLPIPGSVARDAGTPDAASLDAPSLVDAYVDPGEDAGAEDAHRCPAEVCGNGADDDCDGAADCLDGDCVGSSCDDRDPCTHGDACTGSGCAGTPVTCTSTECMDRACNGSATCTSTPRAGACTDDGNLCTTDVCRAGVCAHDRIPDGTPCFLAARCCAGSCTNVTNDPNHCGICGLRCPSGRCLESQCGCSTNSECVSAGYGGSATCYDDPGDGLAARCQCVCNGDSSWRGTCEECPGPGRCDQRDGLNLCYYP